MAKTDFQLAVERTAEVSAAYEPGLRALRRAEVGKVVASDGSRLDGSLNIDDAVAQLYPNENRWDYAIGYGQKVYFVEIHPAYTGEVPKMIAKLNWLKLWLKAKAPKIDALPKSAPAYHWVQSGKSAILPHSREAKLLAKYGLKPKPVLRLK